MVRHPPGVFWGLGFFDKFLWFFGYRIPACAGMTRLGSYDVGFKELRLEYIIFCGGGGGFYIIGWVWGRGYCGGLLEPVFTNKMWVSRQNKRVAQTNGAALWFCNQGREGCGFKRTGGKLGFPYWETACLPEAAFPDCMTPLSLRIGCAAYSSWFNCETSSLTSCSATSSYSLSYALLLPNWTSPPAIADTENTDNMMIMLISFCIIFSFSQKLLLYHLFNSCHKSKFKQNQFIWFHL